MNQYAALLENFDEIPKSVLAAIAVSLALLQNEEDLSSVSKIINDEWRVLHENGIVPQRPRKATRKK